MQSFALQPTPVAALGQADTIGFQSVEVIGLTGTNPGGIMPGDVIQLVGLGGKAGLSLIGFMWPWASAYTYYGALDASGNMASQLVECGNPAGSPPWNGTGLLLCHGIDPDGEQNQFAHTTCFYGPPQSSAPTPATYATLVDAVIAGQGAPFVTVANAYDPTVWDTTAGYSTTNPGAVAYAGKSPAFCVMLNGFGGGIAVTDAVAAKIAAASGGVVDKHVPATGEYPLFDDDPYKLSGSLTPVNYIKQVPGAPGEANAAKLVMAMINPAGAVSAAMLACFH